MGRAHHSKRFNNYDVIADPSGAYVLVELTQGQFTVCDIDDWFGKADGIKWYAAWDDSTQSYYAKAHQKGDGGKPTCVNMNRFVLGLTAKDFFSDHANHNTLDNRRYNLRAIEKTPSACNRRRFSNNSSGFTGVSWVKASRRYLSYIDFKKSRKRIGWFDNAESAAKARDMEAVRIHVDFAVLNFPHLREKFLEAIRNERG